MIHKAPNSQPLINSPVLAVSEPDACKFLQGQLSCDVAALLDGQTTLGAYCTVKGRVMSLFNLTKVGEKFLLSMDSSVLQLTMQELQKYAIFSKVKLAIEEQPMPRIDSLEEITNKIPAVYANTSLLFFPHDLNLPALGAVSFSKGCYRGQEIVARMQHRGNLKRSLYLFETTETPLEPGTEVTTQDKTLAGTVVRCASNIRGSLGLAVLTDSFSTHELFADNIALNVLP